MNDASPARHNKFKAYRARKKAAGLHEVRLWLPDTRSPAFIAEARRQAALADEGDDVTVASDMMERLSAEAGQDWR
ncbi:antitoxin MazE-like protein [Sphingomonas sp.]|jgi:hypothetical protein|uniref:antitoxin MazE-like protein n=1 Tax=Sphingomonas sp. TaxID=28214 RepID=UPI002D7F33B8|nr:antitoxin MazE-like protein [Sphingomonas sp.]HEU0044624.1 antitoxin MazE-like protein [Sphingomonas sp.]